MDRHVVRQLPDTRHLPPFKIAGVAPRFPVSPALPLPFPQRQESGALALPRIPIDGIRPVST
jgi:hypothetical protein